jgi:hypothetical protein
VSGAAPAPLESFAGLMVPGGSGRHQLSIPRRSDNVPAMWLPLVLSLCPLNLPRLRGGLHHSYTIQPPSAPRSLEATYL